VYIYTTKETTVKKIEGDRGSKDEDVGGKKYDEAKQQPCYIPSSGLLKEPMSECWLRHARQHPRAERKYRG
jgi:hypothetical protein